MGSMMEARPARQDQMMSHSAEAQEKRQALIHNSGCEVDSA